MKKIISFILSLCLIYSLFPITSSAETVSDPLQEELFQLARDTFPEYASELHLTHSSRSSIHTVSEDDAVVYSETRTISEKETLTLTELRSGNIFVTKSRPDYQVSSSGSSASQVGSDIIGNATFTVTCTGMAGSITMSNIGFILHQNGTGYLTSYGQEKVSGNNKVATKNSSTTSIRYGLVFNYNGAIKLYVTFYCYVGNGNITGEIQV